MHLGRRHSPPIDAIDPPYRECVLLVEVAKPTMPLHPGGSMSDPQPIITVTDATFEQSVLQSERPVLLKFEADWCGPCQAMKPTIEELASDYGDRLTIATLDIDQNNQTPYRLGVRGVPTVMLFYKGKVVAQKVGLARKVELTAMIDKQVA
jgi:thioredoxin 1